MNTQLTVLGDIPPEDFLRDYWQKKPLLIKAGFDGWENPLSPDELGGLACEETVDARLILERGGEYPWQVKYGPFAEEVLSELPDSHWTLLVRRVDQWVPAVAAIRDRFAFIPNWRLEDVMVSFAAKAGSVGAHIDNYDVFLIQGYGTRRWQIGGAALAAVELQSLNDIAILSEFEAAEEFIVEPGDVLYLPPRYAHAGVALEHCMTYSIGFRAPSHAELIEGYSAAFAERLDRELLYTDSDLVLQTNAGEIDSAVLEQVAGIIESARVDPELISSWFGKLATHVVLDAPLAHSEDIPTAQELASALKEGALLRRTESARVAFREQGDGCISLFVSGEEYRLSGVAAEFGRLFANTASFSATILLELLDNSEGAELVQTLFEAGQVYIGEM